MECFPVRYDSRVVIYDRRAFIILATDLPIGCLYRKNTLFPKFNQTTDLLPVLAIL